MIYRIERDSQAALHIVKTMTLLAANHSAQRTIVIVCVIFALLALPFISAQHCQAMHIDHEQTSTSFADVCCVFLCFATLLGLVIIPVRWLTIDHITLHLKPVRLMNHLTRWVPPPRPIGSLT
jgi:hypothetical protein